MVRPSKKQQIPNLQEAIKETAWNQIAEFGAPALSLRAIARALNITAPAIYNYFPDRDALVTALIIDAYTSFGDFQLAARDEIPADQLIERLKAIGEMYRQWARTYPQRYQLIFGTPLPGYQAPLMEVLPSGARSLSALVSVIDDLRIANKLQSQDYPKIQPGYEPQFEVWKGFAGNYDILSLSVSMIIWSRVHGLVSLEISNNLPPFGVDGSALYHYELESIVRQFVKE
ncbi:MAG: TetR/AcrR family transcriptional regulator [Anaerolineales bacterium]|uniref:TetR/AcrR family transcriptional regulator n=1 Tax=Candidatus Villigracilis affinis TaxID=3140682 RepID=UPI002A1CE68B|nr:TetR/AcrR family transcriptional regulator [Anaerolineales bacterium]MBL0344961.1 TetR/AcrR family transcriptional regulator [Anaerolineales bacterium]